MSEPEESQPEQSPEEGDEAETGPVDQLGIPMSREPTLDDVRGGSQSHRRLAVGCSVIVALLVLLFWLIRGSAL